MSPVIDTPVLLTVRGTCIPDSIDAMRVLHNDTAGSEAGIAAARALGDLSHKVYVPSSSGKHMSNAKPGELLFLDVWEAPAGISQFFSNPHVDEQGSQLFSQKSPTVWMPARGAFTFNLPAASGENERIVGMIRAKVTSPEAAIEAFRAMKKRGLRDCRRRGQLSHELYVKLAAPGDDAAVEILGLDLWTSSAGMLEHYADAESMSGLGGVFAGAPDASIWDQAPGNWSEW